MTAVSVLVFTFAIFSNFYTETSCTTLNDRPIIGIIAQEDASNVSQKKSFIMATNVKFVEASGARAVPIFIHKPRKYYENILMKINGVLFPGGGDLLNGTGYGRTARIIFDIATKLNENGDYFPLWGTCLGFEMLNFAAAKKLWMKVCSADDIVRNIELVDDIKDSKMFSNLPYELKKEIESENTALHLHHWCITPKNFSLSGLDKYYKVLSYSKDANDETFVSIIEAHRFPFYGVSFHPERILFDWTVRKVPPPRSLTAIRISQFLGNFFVSEAKKNHHSFPSWTEESCALIYNYCPNMTGSEPSAQEYIFSYR